MFKKDMGPTTIPPYTGGEMGGKSFYGQGFNQMMGQGAGGITGGSQGMGGQYSSYGGGSQQMMGMGGAPGGGA